MTSASQNLSWDQYFMLVAVISSLRSKDPSSQVGAAIVSPKRHILGTGYNGFVGGVDEKSFPWAHEGDWLSTKYPYVVHAEENAILNSTAYDLEGCSLYTTLFPCNECAKSIAQKRIAEVVYLSDASRLREPREAARIIFTAARIACRRIELSSTDEILGRLRLVLDRHRGQNA